MIIFPYKNGSEGAKALADALGVRQIKRENSRYKGRKDKLVINWGSSTSTEEVDKSSVLNPPEAVALAADKLKWFNHIYEWNDEHQDKHVSIPEFTDDRHEVANILGFPIVCRTVLNGHSGEGIVIANTPNELVPAPLYTEYYKKKSEWRIHVMAGDVVDIQRKVRNPEVPDDQINWQVRNHGNGFIFTRGTAEECPDMVKTMAVRAVEATGLHFGAVDVIYNERYGQAIVLEINTAPGLTGTTLEGYKGRLSAFGEYFAANVRNHGPDELLVLDELMRQYRRGLHW